MARVRKATRRTPLPKRLKFGGAGSAVNLNTRIHRILNAVSELKRFDGTSSRTMPAAAFQDVTYFNPLNAIVQGITLGTRIGDSISVEKVIFNFKWYPFPGASASDFTMTFRHSMLSVQDATLTSTANAAYGGPLVFPGGFPSTGTINNHDLKVLYDMKAMYAGTANTQAGLAPTTGTYQMKPFVHTKSFTKPLKVNYTAGAVTQSKDNTIFVLALETAGAFGGVMGTMFQDYHIFYRDA